MKETESGRLNQSLENRSAEPQLWTTLIKAQNRLVRQHMVWPILSVLMLGVVGYYMIQPSYNAVWVVMVLLAISGALLDTQVSATLGILAFLSYAAWLTWFQLSGGVTGGDFIILALMPFMPLWLSAMHQRAVALMHLETLLSLPQVRAAMDVSEWTLLPTSRALDQRLQIHQLTNPNDPAFLFKIHIKNLDKEVRILGQDYVQREIMMLAEQIRDQLRVGDWIAESLRDHGNLFVLAFPNPKAPEFIPILKRLSPVLKRSPFTLELSYAKIPDDGTRIFNIHWRSAKEALSA